ncbi:MAG: hypothetical protein JSW50_15290 [Candidatus Latescibacterota bacterium]|nr:MAG: hypothetical protein JSW50_15290 [Candidatus Latescibacterota bacterium]
MRPTARALVVAVVGICLLAGGAIATQVIYKTPKQLGQTSTTVVRGTVSEINSYWNANQTKIFTETTIVVDETYKGAPFGTVRIRQLGGVVGNVRVTVHGALHWKQGEEVLVYLEPAKNGAFHIAGFSQGKFNIHRDPQTGMPYVNRPELGGTQMVGIPDGGSRATRIERVPLDRFISQTLDQR